MSPVPPNKIIQDIQVGLNDFIAEIAEAGLITKLDVRFDDHAVYFQIEISTPEQTPAWKGEDDEQKS